MISLEAVVRIVLYLLAAGAIFGALHYLIDYVEQQFPVTTLFCRVARILLVVLTVLLLIGLLLSLVTGQPLFR